MDNEPVMSELIENLFRNYRKPNGREYTNKEVCEAMGTFSPSHLSKLRNGQITNPGRDVLLSLCRFFHVPASYFFPELETPSHPDGLKVLPMVTRATIADPDKKRRFYELIDAALESILDDIDHEE